MTDLVIRHQVAEALLLLDRVMADGKDVRQFMKDWVRAFSKLADDKIYKKIRRISSICLRKMWKRIRTQSEETDLAFINDSIIKLSQTLSDAKWSTQPRILLELCIVKLSTDLAGMPSAPAQGQCKNCGTPAGRIWKNTGSEFDKTEQGKT